MNHSGSGARQFQNLLERSCSPEVKVEPSSLPGGAGPRGPAGAAQRGPRCRRDPRTARARDATGEKKKRGGIKAERRRGGGRGSAPGRAAHAQPLTFFTCGAAARALGGGSERRHGECAGRAEPARWGGPRRARAGPLFGRGRVAAGAPHQPAGAHGVPVGRRAGRREGTGRAGPAAVPRSASPPGSGAIAPCPQRSGSAARSRSPWARAAAGAPRSARRGAGAQTARGAAVTARCPDSVTVLRGPHRRPAELPLRLQGRSRTVLRACRNSDSYNLL